MQPSIGLGVSRSVNQGADYVTLNNFIPTLQGYMKLH